MGSSAKMGDVGTCLRSEEQVGDGVPELAGMVTSLVEAQEAHVCAHQLGADWPDRMSSRGFPVGSREQQGRNALHHMAEWHRHIAGEL